MSFGLDFQGLGCHFNGMFVGAFIYADNVTLLAPTATSLNAMLDTCTQYSIANDIIFNPIKSKCMFFGESHQPHLWTHK